MRSRKVDPTDDDKKNKVDWSQVQGNDIDGVEASAIAKKVRQRTKSLIALRNEAFIRIKDIFPNIRNVDDWESKIQK